MFETFRDKPSNEIRIVLTLKIAYEVFLLYLLGMAIGCTVFFVEILFKFVSMKWCSEIKNWFFDVNAILCRTKRDVGPKNAATES